MAQTAQLRRIDRPENEAQRIFQLQREAYLQHPYPSLDERRERLRATERVLLENREAIAEAIHQDFGHRCREESLMLEVFSCVDGIRHTLKKLPRWTRPERRSVSVMFATGRNRVIPQPKGVVGIVSLHEKLGKALPEDVVAILPGVRAADFSTLPYDHLIFTGSADAGRTVMRAAAENLTPVTLELGGKSPTIVCDDFDVEEAASRILYAKFLNAGQTCLAPDYLFLPEGTRERFVEAARRILPERYPDPKSSSYTSIIDEKSYRRLRETLADAEAKGATLVPLVPGAAFDDGLRKIPPHLVLDVTDEMTIMREEIFGPLLPVKSYRDLDEVIAYVNAKDRPLGFYVFTNDRAREEKLLYSTISGGVTINNCMLHVAQHDLPFGGVGASGMGQYHGREGFLEFSKMRPVFTSPRLSMLHHFYPPYTPRHGRMLDLLLRWKR
jgi:coniferyl-aldehyde dehydrogenase